MSENSALTAKQFKDAIPRILDKSVSKESLPNADVLKDITLMDIYSWNNSLIHIGKTQPQDTDKYPIWVDTSATPIIKYRSRSANGDVNYVETTSGKSAYAVAVENGFEGTEKEWLASLVGEGSKGESGESAYDSAKKGGYTGTKSEFYNLLATLNNISVGNVTSIHYGSEEPTDENLKYWADTSVTPALWKYKTEDNTWKIFAGGSGGGSGGGTSSVDMSLDVDFEYKTISYGDECVLTIDWHSINSNGKQTGGGTFTLYLDTEDGYVKKESYKVYQGAAGESNAFHVILTPYLKLGATEFKVEIEDKTGQVRDCPVTVNTIALSTELQMNVTKPYSGDVPITFKLNGNVPEKKLYVIIDDVMAINGEIITTSQSFTKQFKVTDHGKHSVEAYFTYTPDNGEPIYSKSEYLEFAYIVPGDTTPIIITNCANKDVVQYENNPFDWYVFTPNADGSYATYTPSVKIYENNTGEVGETERPTQELENVGLDKARNYEFKPTSPGDRYVIFKVGEYTYPIHFSVAVNPIEVNAHTMNMGLYLTAANRSQDESSDSRTKWNYLNPETNETIEGVLTDFNFTSDGWMPVDGSTVLRLRGKNKVEIPYAMFTDDAFTNGRTLEVEFKTREVMDYDATIMECMHGGIGFYITAQKFVFKSLKETIEVPFKEEEHVRVSIVIESNAKNPHFMLVYINGVLSSICPCVNDIITQTTPKGITIGSELCAIDVYCIRAYEAALSKTAILKNWIADTQDPEERINRYKRNAIYDEFENIDFQMATERQVQEPLPFIVLYANESDLPLGKTDDIPVSGKFVDPSNESRNFTFTAFIMNVQGTSSLSYPIKNYTLFVGEDNWLFAVSDESIPTYGFCFKADYASSEGANNVVLVDIFNEFAPKIPPQKANPKIRQGIDGFPMVMFLNDGKSYKFMGKYNFNNDKGTPEVFGMLGEVESWEIDNNDSPDCKFKETHFDTDAWKAAFKARYAENKNDTTNIRKLAEWICSTDRYNPSDSPIDRVTFNTKVTVDKDGVYHRTTEQVTFDEDSELYRLTKFVNEVEDYCDLDHLVFFYTFTELFLMVDNWAKNTFPTRYFNEELNKWLWHFLPYDFDTALGIDNVGKSVFDFGLETTDKIGDNYVYYAGDSVLWNNVRDLFWDKIKDTYLSLRKQGLSYEYVVDKFRTHQSRWGEAIFNEDSYRKYIEPNNEDHYSKLQGNKDAARVRWLYNRFKYMDSKYLASSITDERIVLATHKADTISLTPYADVYTSIAYASGTITKSQRAKKGQTVDFEYPEELSDASQGYVWIYAASQLSDIGDLSGLMLSTCDIQKAPKLQRIIIGRDGDYSNEWFTDFTAGNNTLLKVADFRNCTALGTGTRSSLNLSGCSSIEEVYCENTKITACELPFGGGCRVLHLPDTIADLTVINHRITDFSMPSYGSLRKINLELNEISESSFDIKKMIDEVTDDLGEDEKCYLRIKNFHLTGDLGFNTAEEVLDWYGKVKSNFTGINANGDVQETIELKGVIDVKEKVSGEQYVQMKNEFPDITVNFKEIEFTLFFYPDIDEQGEPVAVTIKDLDGDKLGDGFDPVGTTYMPETPTKAEDANYRYVFKGWDDDLQKVESVRNVHATYYKYRKYKRTFVDRFEKIIPVNGKETNTYYLLEGQYDRLPSTTPTWATSDIIQPSDQSTWESTVNGLPYNNEFDGWVVSETDVPQMVLPNIQPGDGFDVTYIPHYNPKRVYIVKYIDQDDGVEVFPETRHYLNDTLTTPTNPTKERTNYEYFVFSHWVDSNGTTITDFSSISVKEDTVVYAVFDSYTINYKVVFKKHDGTVLQEVSGTKTYSENLSSLYTGAKSWTSLYKTEELKGWKISTELKNGAYYLYYTASLYTEEKVRLSAVDSNGGEFNKPGEPKDICDGSDTTKHGFNIGVANMFQGSPGKGFHHYVRLGTTLSTIPEGTIFNEMKLKAITQKNGYKENGWNYTCRFMMYLQSRDAAGWQNLSTNSYMVDANDSGSQPFERDKSTLSKALEWMSKNTEQINSGNFYLRIEGSNIYVYEVYMTLYYTT